MSELHPEPPAPQPFTADQLSQLERHLDPSLVAWAGENPTTSVLRDNDRGLVHSLAAVHAYGKLQRAKGWLTDFGVTQRRGIGMHTMVGEFGLRQPREMAGMAAGLVALARTLTVWYGLRREDFALLDQPTTNTIAVAMPHQELQHTVCTTPKTLGITTFTARDAYMYHMFAAENSVVRQGAAALAPHLHFPEYPIIPSES
jgi:hypothetical protein